jgi:hypothetical protein
MSNDSVSGLQCAMWLPFPIPALSVHVHFLKGTWHMHMEMEMGGIQQKLNFPYN